MNNFWDFFEVLQLVEPETQNKIKDFDPVQMDCQCALCRVSATETVSASEH